MNHQLNSGTACGCTTVKTTTGNTATSLENAESLSSHPLWIIFTCLTRTSTTKTRVNNLMCRIQNFQSDHCAFCGQQYCVKLGDKPLLSCAIYGQWSYDACILSHLGIPPEDNTTDPEDVTNKLNSTRFTGFHYLCGECIEFSIPDKEVGLSKKNLSRPNNSLDMKLMYHMNRMNHFFHWRKWHSRKKWILQLWWTTRVPLTAHRPFFH